jgi:ABC-type multidrug transport system ATPase subunit
VTAPYPKTGIATVERRTEAQPTYPPSLRAHGVRIDVNHLSRQVRVRNRGDVTLLDSVSFTLSAGELVGIVGPSGAGKTTLLEAIAGIAPATSGSVHFDGIDMQAHPGAFRNVLGYVPQEDILHTDLSLKRTLRRASGSRLRQLGPRSTTQSVTPSTPSA